MADAGAFFYDRTDVFKNYMDRRQQETSANDTLEIPIIKTLLPDLKGKSLLDVGCGDGQIATSLFEQGLKRYLGFDGSQNMVDLAQKSIDNGEFQAHHQIRVEQGFIENWDYPTLETFDVVLSRLAFHYVEAVEPVFEKVYQALREGGSFVFSVEHPVITSHQVSMKEGANRKDWAVDRYFEPGKRTVSWLGGQVLKYHRTVEHYFQALKSVGFTIDDLRESEPRPELFKSKSLLDKRRRVPLFLFFHARK
jgi:SAM-dependent methyltransferase